LNIEYKLVENNITSNTEGGVGQDGCTECSCRPWIFFSYFLFFKKKKV